MLVRLSSIHPNGLAHPTGPKFAPKIPTARKTAQQNESTSNATTVAPSPVLPVAIESQIPSSFPISQAPTVINDHVSDYLDDSFTLDLMPPPTQTIPRQIKPPTVDILNVLLSNS